uniref:Uncharacterized protein AlNc14C168G7926 n=1 Tax=Albugo laibachii Nc14 TaxID=890382 RepID=F0WN94_9STRA|nr:conserved hypothetical protein [Albugo laibachii Nc14]|eukprot:CCA22783.1 conserved hypothetical protein [Albugo laibachii Nc14]
MYKQDGLTTYCYLLDDSYTVNFPSRSNILASGIDGSCPIQLHVRFPKRTERNQLIEIQYSALMNPSYVNPAFQFPKPVQSVKAPKKTIANSKTRIIDNSQYTHPSDQTFQIPVANVVICDWRECDIFTDLNALNRFYASSSSPENFTFNAATFTSNDNLIADEGRYTAFVHVVVQVSLTTRADIVTFFPVQIGDSLGEPPTKLLTDGISTYCWVLPETSVFDTKVSTETNIRINSFCPGAMRLDVSKPNVLVGELVTFQWSLQIDGGTLYSDSLIADVSTSNAVRNPKNGIYSVIPISVLSACRRNGDEKCSSYPGGDPKTFYIKECSDHNLTSGTALYKYEYAFDKGGDYTLAARVVMQTPDGDRVDMAVYNSITVTVSTKHNSLNILYYTFAAGILLLLAIAGLYLWWMKRRSRDNLKGIPIRKPFPTAYFDPPQSHPQRSLRYFGFRDSTPTSHSYFHGTPKFGRTNLESTFQDEYYPQSHSDLNPHTISKFRDVSSSERSDHVFTNSNAIGASSLEDLQASDWGLSVASNSTEDFFSDSSSLSDVVQNPNGTAIRTEKLVSNLPILEIPAIVGEERVMQRNRHSSSWSISPK